MLSILSIQLLLLCISIPTPQPELSTEHPSQNTMNPYGQGWWQQGGATPSIFGALPSLPLSNNTKPLQGDTVTFEFSNFKTTILNSTVYAQQRACYRIITENSAPACTVFKDNESRNIAMIQWQPNAQLEMRGTNARVRARDWLRLSSDQSRRIIEIGGVQYAWAPMEGFICLYKVHTSAPRVLGRIARVPNTVTLELTQEAIQLGLLEPSLIATVLLNCGHNID